LVRLLEWVPYRQRGHLHWQSGYYGRILVGFPYVAPPPPLSAPFFGSSLMLFLNLRAEESGGKGREEGVRVCMCFYLSWWRSFQGASARDNAKGVEIMKLMIVCIMRDTRISISSFGIPGEQARGCLCCVT
jgi:hypothetical protein